MSTGVERIVYPGSQMLLKSLVYVKWYKYKLLGVTGRDSLNHMKQPRDFELNASGTMDIEAIF